MNAATLAPPESRKIPARISEHFSYAEMTYNGRGLPNHPDTDQLTALTLLCGNVLEPIRQKFGPVNVNSAFRSGPVNLAVGGAKNSDHMLGHAADIECDAVSNAELWKWIVANLDFDQCIAEKLSRTDPRAGWVHVSFRAGRNRHQAISFLGKGRGYVTGLQFID